MITKEDLKQEIEQLDSAFFGEKIMQTITFTANDQIGQLLHTIATENNKPTSEVIADSLRYYSEMLQKRKWQQQIKIASTLVAAQSLKVNQLLEASNADGL